MFILDDILLAPINGLLWLGQKIKEQADAEHHDLEAIKEALRELQELHEMGFISTDELEKAEEVWLLRLEEAQAYQRGRHEE